MKRLAAALLLWLPLVAAAGFQNGIEYLKWPRMLKIMYVSGSYDALEAAFDLAGGAPGEGKQTLPICMPQSVSAEQMTDVVTKYVRNHPAERHRSAAELARISLMQAFPCAPAVH